MKKNSPNSPPRINFRELNVLRVIFPGVESLVSNGTILNLEFFHCFEFNRYISGRQIAAGYFGEESTKILTECHTLVLANALFGQDAVLAQLNCKNDSQKRYKGINLAF